MKTLEETKQAVAQEQGYKNWYVAREVWGPAMTERMIDTLVKAYAEQAITADREHLIEHITLRTENIGGMDFEYVNERSIIEAPRLILP